MSKTFNEYLIDYIKSAKKKTNKKTYYITIDEVIDVVIKYSSSFNKIRIIFDHINMITGYKFKQYISADIIEIYIDDILIKNLNTTLLKKIVCRYNWFHDNNYFNKIAIIEINKDNLKDKFDKYICNRINIENNFIKYIKYFCNEDELKKISIKLT